MGLTCPITWGTSKDVECLEENSQQIFSHQELQSTKFSPAKKVGNCPSSPDGELSTISSFPKVFKKNLSCFRMLKSVYIWKLFAYKGTVETLG